MEIQINDVASGTYDM